MKHLFKLTMFFFVSLALYNSCSGNEDVIDPVPVIPEINPEFPTNPGDTDSLETVKIIFDFQSATITNPFEKEGVTVTRHEAHVVIQSTTTDTITYILTGSTPNGSLKIYSETQFILILNGVDIINSNDPAINIQTKKKTSITLYEGTSNRLVGGLEFASEGGDEKMKAALYSRGQFVFSGDGSLEVISRYRHAICSDDYIRVNGGTITIPFSYNDGMHANDYIEINDGTVDIYSVGDGMDSEGYILITGGTIHITTTGHKSHGIKSATETTVQSSDPIEINVEGDASKAFKCTGDMLISQCNLDITTTGDARFDDEEGDISSASGIKCNSNLLIDGGRIIINSSGVGGKGISVDRTLTINDGELDVTTIGNVFKASNDNTKAKAIKSDGNCTINGGLIYADSKTDNAIATKGSLTITDGTIMGIARELSKKGFACDKTFKISGGTVYGIGNATSAPTASVCTQYVVNYSGKLTQNSFLNISSSDNNNILTCQLPCTLSKSFILFSSPGLIHNTNYSISSGGAVSGGDSFHGLFNNAIYSGGTSLASFRVSSIITTVN